MIIDTVVAGKAKLRFKEGARRRAPDPIIIGKTKRGFKPDGNGGGGWRDLPQPK
jgi:hypothetical protein